MQFSFISQFYLFTCFKELYYGSKKPRSLKRELPGSEYKQLFGSGGKGKLILNRKKPLTGLGLLVR